MKHIFHVFILLASILSLSLLFYFYAGTKKEKTSLSEQLIQPEVIATCSNQNTYQLVLQYVHNKEATQISVGASIDDPNVQVQKVSTEPRNTYTKIILDLKAPKEESHFNLTLNINDKNYTVKTLHIITSIQKPLLPIPYPCYRKVLIFVMKQVHTRMSD